MYSSWSTKPSPFLSMSSKVSWKIVLHWSNQERTENSCYSPLRLSHVWGLDLPLYTGKCTLTDSNVIVVYTINIQISFNAEKIPCTWMNWTPHLNFKLASDRRLMQTRTYHMSAFPSLCLGVKSVPQERSLFPFRSYLSALNKSFLCWEL